MNILPECTFLVNAVSADPKLILLSYRLAGRHPGNQHSLWIPDNDLDALTVSGMADTF